jgi:hypothetical protein
MKVGRDYISSSVVSYKSITINKYMAGVGSA